MEETLTVIPDIAWEQAVFVCLFIILVIGLLRWFSKQQANWQDFINSQNAEWRGWMDKAEIRTATQMRNVTSTLEKLAEKLDRHDQRVMDKLEAHDDKVDDRIEKVKENSAN